MASESLNFNLFAKDNASRVFDKFGRTVADTESGMHKVGRGMLAVGKVAAVGLAAGVAGGAIAFRKFTGDARESERVTKLTAAIIKSTGGAAKVSAKQVAELSLAISNKTGVDDEAIQTGSNLLLTFKNVRDEVGKGNKVFSDATAAAVDLSAAGFGSIDSASKMLGKALNDPIKGLTALGRAGVTFTAAQQEQIKTYVKHGELLKAQKVILGEVTSEVGGAAAATGTATDKLKVKLGNISEEIGTRLLPFIDKAASWLGEKLPGAFDAASNFVGPILTKIGDAGPQIAAKVGEWFGKIQGAIDSAVITLGPIVTQIRQGIAGAFKFGSEVVTAINQGDWAAVGVAFGEALTKVASGAEGLTKAMRAWIAGVDWMALGKAASAAAVPFIIAFVNDLTINFLKFTKAHPLSAIEFVAAIIPIGKVAGLLEKILGKLPIVGPILRALAGAGKAVEGGVFKLFGIFGKIGDHIAPALTASIRNLMQDVVFVIRSYVADFMAAAAHAGRSILIAILRPFAGIGDRFASLGADLVRGFIRGIASLAGAAKQAAEDMAKAAFDGARRFLHIDSPSKVMIEIGEFFVEGFAIGTKKGTAKALEAVQSLTDKVISKLQGLRSKAASIRQTAADAVRGMFNFGDIGAVTTGTDADGNPTSSTASPVQQFADFANQSRQFAAAVSAAVAKGINPAIIAGTANTGNLTAVSALAALDPSSVQSVNRDFALAQKFAAQVGQTVLSTTPLPAQIAREEAMLTELRAVKDALKNHKTVVDIDIDGKRFARAVARDIREELDNMTQRRGGGTLAPKR